MSLSNTSLSISGLLHAQYACLEGHNETHFLKNCKKNEKEVSGWEIRVIEGEWMHGSVTMKPLSLYNSYALIKYIDK
jgi:hypothetical protein